MFLYWILIPNVSPTYRSSLPCSTTLIVLTSSLCQSSFPSPSLQSYHYTILYSKTFHKCIIHFFSYCTAKTKYRNFETNIPRKGVSVPISTFMRLWVIYKFPRSVCLFCWRKYVDRSWDYINRSQTHECGNWGWGRAIPRKGMQSEIFVAVCLSFILLWTITGRGTSPYIVLRTPKKTLFSGCRAEIKTCIHLAACRRTNNAIPYITLSITNLILMLVPFPSLCFVLPNLGIFFFMVLSLSSHQHRRKSRFLSAYS
jgi:hypothetical protein